MIITSVNYITFILETWIHILRDILLNNVTKKYAELSVGVYGMLIQRRNASVTTGLRRATIGRMQFHLLTKQNTSVRRSI